MTFPTDPLTLSLSKGATPDLIHARASSSAEERATSRATIARLELAEALDRLESMQSEGLPVADQVDTLVRHHGASVRFTNGTNVFRCCGVTGTCTSDKGASLLASWARIGERRLGTDWPKGGARGERMPDPLPFTAHPEPVEGSNGPTTSIVSPGLTRAKASSCSSDESPAHG